MTSFYPASASRATSQLAISRLLFQLNNDQSAIQDLQTQLSTGRRITKASEDPSAAIRGLAAQRQLEFKAQTDKNLKSADSILAASESSLSQAQALLNDVRGLAVQSVGTAQSPQETEATLSQIQATLEQLANLGNSKFRDQYIFGGSKLTQSPFRLDGDAVQFTGNADELHTITDAASTLAANVTAEQAFGVKSSEVVGNVDLNPSVRQQTPLSHLNRGIGVRGGVISLSNGSQRIEVDMTNAFDLSDVMERIESVEIGGRELDVSLSSNGLKIAYADGLPGNLRIDDVGGGNMSKDLKINNTGSLPSTPVAGGDLNPIMTRATRLDDLFDGSGLVTSGNSLQINQGDRSYSISIDDAQTIEDLINRVENSGAKVEASIDSSGRFLRIQSTESGTRLSIGEEGWDVATTLGLRTFAESTRLSELNNGQGVTLNPDGPDLIFTRVDGTEMEVNLSGLHTVGEVLNQINNNTANFVPGARITASLATQGNGIVLSSDLGDEPLRVRSAGDSHAAWELGLVETSTEAAAGELSGPSSVIRGRDTSGVEVNGVFNTLIRMRQAIENGRQHEMTEITASLDRDIHRLAMARGLVGTRQQNVASIQELSTEQQLQLTQIESQELDADFAQVISDLTGRQTALQASLSALAQTGRQSLFDFL